MIFWALMSVSLFLYVLGFIVNPKHEEIFSRDPKYVLHIRWWLSTLTVSSIMMGFIDLDESIFRWSILSFVGSLMFFGRSWLKK